MIFHSTARLFKILSFLLFVLYIVVLFHTVIITTNTLLIGVLFFSLYLPLYLYVSTYTVIINKKDIIIKHVFCTIHIPIHEITRIDFTYQYKETSSVFPYLQISTASNCYYIPSMIYERNATQLYTTLQNKILKNYM